MIVQAGWQVTRTAAGAITEPSGLVDDEVGRTWVTTNVPATAASAWRTAQLWSLDDPRGVDFDRDDWWWRVRVDATGPHVLGLDGVATLYDVFWNGARIGGGDNMFVAQQLAVDGVGANELAIRCRALAPELAKKRPRPRWRTPMIEQQQLRWFRTTLLGRTPGWSPPCPPVGPWRRVWLVAAGEPTWDPWLAVRLDESADVGIVRVTSPRPGRAAIGEQGCQLAQDATGAYVGEVMVSQPMRWWPHTHGVPHRYPVALDGVLIGQVGFRKIEIERTYGDFVVRVNDVRVFCRGACWTPSDPVTLAATAEELEAQVHAARAANLNMIRIGGTMTYPDRALLDSLDAHGILLWQDLMFANMDYPDELDVDLEVTQACEVLRGHACVAIVCGNSEGGQQAAMAGATRDRWQPALFHERLRDRVAAVLPDAAYVASSTDGGAYPHACDTGVTSYYGVGAYLRGFDDLRRSEVVFASEALAFANIGDDIAPGARVHHAAWKTRAPRDLGAGWDFDDVRDHYVKLVFGVEPNVLRASDHDRYVALGKYATGEVMARAFAEWRRARSGTRGALVWFLRDLWAGAGWGIFDSRGVPKQVAHHVRRACAAQAIAITDEGNNGLALHVANDLVDPLLVTLHATLVRAGDVVVARGAPTELAVPGRDAAELPIAGMFEGWYDLSYAFRFGPPVCDVVHVRAVDRTSGADVGEAVHFVGGQLPATRELDVGLTVVIEAVTNVVAITAKRFAAGVTIEATGWIPEDGGFHVMPGATVRVAMRAAIANKPLKGVVSALNSEATARF